MSMRRAARLLGVVPLLAACTLAQPTSAPSSGSPTPTPTPATTLPPAASPTPEPTPGPEDVPSFSAGSQVATNAPGLRVRSRPGMDARVITSLGVDANLLVGLGPVIVDGLGWYLVRDADDADPAFGEGWVAAGFQPDPFLINASFDPGPNPYLAGFANDADGEYGPVPLTDPDVSLRWFIAPLDAGGCSFAVDLRPGSGAPVPAIRATLGTAPAPGELFSQFFASHPELRGDLFVTVTSDCSWALTFVRQLPETTATPSA